MSISISGMADERSYEQYRELRDAPRQTISNGVYPNCKKALSEYSILVDALSGDMSGYAELHTAMIAQVSPHIASIQQAMQNIVDTVEAIEAAAPGTFGIELPSEDA